MRGGVCWAFRVSGGTQGLTDAGNAHFRQREASGRVGKWGQEVTVKLERPVGVQASAEEPGAEKEVETETREKMKAPGGGRRKERFLWQGLLRSCERPYENSLLQK